GRNELARGWSKDRADGCDDWLFRSALVVESNDYRALGRKMALVDRAGHMLPDAEEFEIHGRVGIAARGIPLVGPGHRNSYGISRLDVNVHAAASGRRMVHAASVQAGWFKWDGLAVGRSPVEDAVILRARNGSEGADEKRNENGRVLHTRSICWG